MIRTQMHAILLSPQARIESGGGIVAFQTMKYVGIPLAHWQLAARSCDGDRVTKLQALAFHMVRTI